MKVKKLIPAGLWILSLVGISIKGGPITYGFFAVATLIPLILLGYIFLVFWLLKIYQKMEGRSQVCDQNTDFYFTLQNESFIAFSGVRVTFFSNFSTISGLDDGNEYELMPHEGISLKTGLSCKYRGSYEVGVRDIIISDFWNIFSISFKNKNTLSAVVFPKIVHLANMNGSFMAAVCERESKMKKNDVDVFNREYVYGDEVRLMQWKASAGKGKLFVRERTGEEEPGAALIMDSCRYGLEEEEFLPIENKLLELNLAISCYLLKKNIPVRNFYLNSGKIAGSRMGNLSAFDAFYAEMCAFSFSSVNENRILAEGIRNCNEIRNSHLVVIMVHSLTQEMMNLAVGYADEGIPVMLYLVSDAPRPETEMAAGCRNIEFLRIRTDADLLEVLQ